MTDKKVLFIDMDGVTFDFQSAIDSWFERNLYCLDIYKERPDTIPTIFKELKPIDGAVEGIHKLYENGKYDMFIATTAPWDNPQSNMDKRISIETYFGNIFYKRMFITHRKDLLMGDILIDDRLKNGASEFKGQFIHFGWDYENNKWNDYPDWNSVLEELL